jgi:hypothetical protein
MLRTILNCENCRTRIQRRGVSRKTGEGERGTYDKDTMTGGFELRQHATEEDEFGGGFSKVDEGLFGGGVARFDVGRDEVRVTEGFAKFHENVAEGGEGGVRGRRGRAKKKGKDSAREVPLLRLLALRICRLDHRLDSRGVALEDTTVEFPLKNGHRDGNDDFRLRMRGGRSV